MSREESLLRARVWLGEIEWNNDSKRYEERPGSAMQDEPRIVEYKGTEDRGHEMDDEHS